jgi:hypothetical protein
MAANNNYLGHTRQLTLTTLRIEPGNDPPLDASVPASHQIQGTSSVGRAATGKTLPL